MSIHTIGAKEAAKVIRRLNEKIEEKEMLVIKGEVSADHFAERYFGKNGERDAC